MRSPAQLTFARKAEAHPAVVVRGLRLEGDGTAQEIVIDADLDLFLPKFVLSRCF